MERPKTIFCDIDGTLWDHVGDITEQVNVVSHKLLPNTMDALNRWDKLGYKIILTTGRRESMRSLTEHHLKKLGIVYDILIMGLGGGPRVLVNDRKPNSSKNTAFAVNLVRNEGIKFYDFGSNFCVIPDMIKENKLSDRDCSKIEEYNDNYIVSRVELFSTNEKEELIEYHKLMRKTFSVYDGELFIKYWDGNSEPKEKTLKCGDTLTIEPKIYYCRFTEKGCKYFVTSTVEFWE